MNQTQGGENQSRFGGSHHAGQFYESPTHEEALARLQFLVDNGRRMGLLLGRAGSGKSLLLEVFARTIRRSGGHVAAVNPLGLDGHEFAWSLAAELGVNPALDASPLAIWRAIFDKLVENGYQRLHTVLLVDDADEAGPDVLTQVARLAQWTASSGAPVTIVLAAKVHGYERLGTRLLQRTELRIEIEPWERADTAECLRQTLAAVGRDASVFTEPAVSRLHELAGGVPRRVTQLSELSLLAGAGQDIDDHTVEAAHRELAVAGVASGRDESLSERIGG